MLQDYGEEDQIEYNRRRIEIMEKQIKASILAEEENGIRIPSCMPSEEQQMRFYAENLKHLAKVIKIEITLHADKEIARIEKASEDELERVCPLKRDWISVKKQLPPEDTCILAYGKKYPYPMFVVHYFLDECKYITHWMPLPSSPKEEE